MDLSRGLGDVYKRQVRGLRESIRRRGRVGCDADVRPVPVPPWDFPEALRESVRGDDEPEPWSSARVAE
jgi:hypothetical protein